MIMAILRPQSSHMCTFLARVKKVIHPNPRCPSTRVSNAGPVKLTNTYSEPLESYEISSDCFRIVSNEKLDSITLAQKLPCTDFTKLKQSTGKLLHNFNKFHPGTITLMKKGEKNKSGKPEWKPNGKNTLPEIISGKSRDVVFLFRQDCHKQHFIGFSGEETVINPHNFAS